MQALHDESNTYDAQFERMLAEHPGQYVVIQGSYLHHFSDSYEGALKWAYDKFGLDNFLVQKVDREHSIAHFTRDLGTCRT